MNRGDRDPTIELFTHPLSLLAIILGKTLGKSSQGSNWPGRPTMANGESGESRAGKSLVLGINSLASGYRSCLVPPFVADSLGQVHKADGHR